MRAFNVFLTVVVSLVICAVVLEGGLRLVGMGPTNALVHFDSKLGWSNVPNKVVHRSTREFDVTYAINGLGLRDDPMVSPKKPDGTYRVVCLGDSFTLGWAVDRENLFVDQLERWWKAEGRKVDVINAGTEGYSTDQEVAWLLENGEAYSPDLVLLFAYENDLYWNGQTSYVSGQEKPLFDGHGNLVQTDLPAPPEKTFLDRLAVVRVGRMFTSPPSPDFFFEIVPGEEGKKGKRALREWAPLLVEQPAFMEEPLERTRGALLALRAKCEELGARCVLVPIPSHSAVDPGYRERFARKTLRGLAPEKWSADKPVETFLALSKDAGVSTLDPRSALREKQSGGTKLYNTIDWHLNPDGNAAFATFLHDEIDRLGVFPDALAAQSRSGMPTATVARSFPTWPKVFGVLLVVLSVLYKLTWRDEPIWLVPLKVGGLLALIFAIAIGGNRGLSFVPPQIALMVLGTFVIVILTFVAYKLGRRLGTIAELFACFVRRGHWYLMPLVVVLLTIGSLLVVAASSPFVAPFIYTLF